MKNPSPAVRGIAAMATAMAIAAGPVLAQGSAECLLPKEKRLAVTSTVVQECGRGTADPSCNKIAVKVSGLGANCKAELPYGTLKVIKRGSGNVTWVLSDTSGVYNFDSGKGIDISLPAPYYDAPGLGGSGSKFKWHTNGKKNPAGTLHHCPVVYQNGVLCAAQDPIIVNVE